MHALDIILRVSQSSEIERIFKTGLDAGNAARDFAGYKGLAADRASWLNRIPFEANMP